MKQKSLWMLALTMALIAEAGAQQYVWFFIDSTVNFHSLQQNPVLQID